MKGVVSLINPEEQYTVEIDAWARLMFERNATKLGIPPMPTRDAARTYPETFMCICSYYALIRQGLFQKVPYADFELRWDGIAVEGGDNKEDLVNPTNPAQ